MARNASRPGPDGTPLQGVGGFRRDRSRYVGAVARIAAGSIRVGVVIALHDRLDGLIPWGTSGCSAR